MSNDATADVSAFDQTIVASAEPVAASERNHSIDTLRGVAVLGILVMNIYIFAMPYVAYSNPLAFGGEEPWNVGTWFFSYLFFDFKFLAIFSMLFGAGLVMMQQRAEKRGVDYGAVWLRRNSWLLLIGLLHGYLLWVGDVLFAYAIIGLLIYWLRDRSPTALIRTGIILLMIAPVFMYSGGVYMDQLAAAAAEYEELQESGAELSAEQIEVLEDWEAMRSMIGAPEEQVRKDIEGHQQGYLGILAYRLPTITMLQTQGFFGFSLWRIGGLMLVGMAFMKLGVISGDRSSRFYKRMLLLGYGIGLPIVAFGAWNLSVHQWDAVYGYRIGSLPNYVGSVFVAFGHIALVMTVIKSGACQGLMRRFAAVGRMAFTNYLTHSIILTTVFYGYGFGLYGEVPRLGQMGFVAAVIGLQLLLSPVWLRHYRFGPAEWLWRSLTYWRIQPMRRDPR